MRRTCLAAALLAWLLALTALPAIGPDRRPAPPPPSPAASSFSQLLSALAHARITPDQTVIVLRARVRVEIYVGMGDPVNRWDPSGLDDIEFVPLETGPNGENLSLVFWRSMQDGTKRDTDVMIPIGVAADTTVTIPARYQRFMVPESYLITPGSVSRMVPIIQKVSPERIEVNRADWVDLILPLIEPGAQWGTTSVGLGDLQAAARSVNTGSALGIVDSAGVQGAIADAIAAPILNPPPRQFYMSPGSPLVTRRVTVWSDFAWGPVSWEFTATEREWAQIDSAMPFIDPKGSTIRVAGEMGMAAWAAGDLYMLGRAGLGYLGRQGTRQAAGAIIRNGDDLTIAALNTGEDVARHAKALAARSGELLGTVEHVMLAQGDDVLRIVTHGSPTAVMGAGGEGLAASELAALLTANGFRANRIELLACNTGLGKFSFAQQLANQLGVKVKGPLGLVNIAEGIVGFPQVRQFARGPLMPPGYGWKTFDPQGRIHQWISRLIHGR